MAFAGKVVVITGASMGIGAATARRLAAEGTSLVLLSRSEDKLAKLAHEIERSTVTPSSARIRYFAVNVQDHTALATAMATAVAELGPIDVLVNNAGLAIAAPATFPNQSIADISTMLATNLNGFMFAAHAVLNEGQMLSRGRGTILNVTSTTALEAPPFPGEAVYHSVKAAQDAFSNSLRIELSGTNIRVAVIRPGVVATHFHVQRVGYDGEQYNDFIRGYEPLLSEDVADAVAWMLSTHERVSVKALDVVPTAQRSLAAFDRTWNERNAKPQ